MKIQQTRIRSAKKYLIGLTEDEDFYISFTISNELDAQKAQNTGFSTKLEIGEQVLPKVIGTKTDFNANGSFDLLKHLRKETKYREIEIKDWHGDSHWVDVPYKRYQRSKILAPSVHIVVSEKNDGQKIIISPKCVNSAEQYVHITHTINIFLEIFGECEILKENLTPSIDKIKNLNWKILPSGKQPWSKIQGQVSAIIKRHNKDEAGKQKRIEHRIFVINNKNPDFVAIGNAGFHGYMIFGFKELGIYILESVHWGNATYVFGNDWEQLSKLTKKDILDGSLQKVRIVHSKNWVYQINKLFKLE
jgi:hypothetical protein